MEFSHEKIFLAHFTVSRQGRHLRVICRFMAYLCSTNPYFIDTSGTTGMENLLYSLSRAYFEDALVSDKETGRNVEVKTTLVRKV